MHLGLLVPECEEEKSISGSAEQADVSAAGLDAGLDQARVTGVNVAIRIKPVRKKTLIWLALESHAG
jgi:hypothetical protein